MSTRQRQRDSSEAPLGDLLLVHKFMLQRVVLNVFLGGMAVLSTGLPHPPLVSVTVANGSEWVFLKALSTEMLKSH